MRCYDSRSALAADAVSGPTGAALDTPVQHQLRSAGTLADQQEMLSPAQPTQMQVQLHGDGGGNTAAQIQSAAATGLSGSGGSLPFQAQIQRSFGDHDVSGVSADHF